MTETKTESLPCGVMVGEVVSHEITFREMTGVDEDAYLSLRKQGAMKMTRALFDGCIVSIGGVEEDKERIKLIRSMLSGDRIFALLRLRQISLGDDFSFPHICGACDYKGKYDVDLSTLEVTPMPEPGKREYEVTLPRSKQVVKFGMMAEEQEHRVARMKADRLDMMTSLIVQRVISIGDGEKHVHLALRELSTRDRAFLRGAFEEVDGGVDLSIEGTCDNPECASPWQMELPVHDPSFLFPTG